MTGEMDLAGIRSRPVCLHVGTDAPDRNSVHLNMCSECTFRLWENAIQLAEEVERIKNADWVACHVCREPVHGLFDLDGTDDGTKPLCRCCYDEHKSGILRLGQELAASAVKNEGLRELSDAKSHYIWLLEGELTETVPIANNHGWESTRWKEGEDARTRIDAALLKDEKNQNEANS